MRVGMSFHGVIRYLEWLKWNSAENKSLRAKPSLKELGLRLKHLHSIVEKGNDNLSSTESELSNERNEGPMSVPPMGDQQSGQRDRSVSSQRDIEQSISRSSRRDTPVTRRKRKGSKHVRSSLDSGIPNDVMEQIKYETMLIHSDHEDPEHPEDDTQNMEQQKSPNERPNGSHSKLSKHSKHKMEDIHDAQDHHSDDTESEDEEYLKNRERLKRGKKRRKQSHSRSINMSMDGDTLKAIHNETETLSEMEEMRALQVPMVSTSPESHRKYSESYSININQHHQAASTRAGGTLKSMAGIHSVPSPVKLTSVFGHVDSRRKRSGSYDIDVGQNITPSVHYEREVSRTSNVALGLHDMDPLTLKNQEHQDATKLRGFSVQQNVQNVLLPPVSDDEDSEEEEDVMSDLSDAANGNVANPSNVNGPNGADDESEEDSVSELEADSMSELSADHGTFIIHGDTLKNGLDAERLKEEQRKEEERQKEQNSNASKPKVPTKSEDNRTEKYTENRTQKPTKRKSSSRKLISLMNSTFILQIVPDSFPIINSFITQQLTQKPSYILTICNNTTSHDLFFKTSFVYNSRSKHLRYFKESQEREDMVDTNGVVVIDDEGSDDHLAPMEEMTFGDIHVKKGFVYGGYFVFEAYPFLDMAQSDAYGTLSRQAPTVITPHNPVTPQKLVTNATLNAIDENNKSPDVALFGGFQCPELQLGAMNPSTVNKYRRQSLSSNSSRRTSLVDRTNNVPSPKKGRNENEMSVTSLLGKALDEEQESVANLPWNDGLDDLIDVVIGYEVKLSVGDAELNEFRCFMRFNDYRQPLYYQNEFKGVNDLKDKCHGGSDGLQCVGGIDDKLQGKVAINDPHTVHPQIVFNIGYSISGDDREPSRGSRRLSSHELVDID